jgi:2,3-bisphosphoglycerate-dependent phosphoglycerate mutase
MGEFSPMSKNDPTTHYITLVRHGQSQANEKNVLQGQMDSPLSKDGALQTQALAAYWHSEGITFNKIISSPLGRAYETASIISELLKIPIELVEQWKEREFGKAEGLLYEEIFAQARDLPPRSVYDPAYETGESDWDLYIRAANAVQELTYRPEGRYLVVSHGAIMNAALSVIIGITPTPPTHRIRFRFNNTGYTDLEYNAHNQNWSISLLNSTFHLNNLEQNNEPPSD